LLAKETVLGNKDWQPWAGRNEDLPLVSGEIDPATGEVKTRRLSAGRVEQLVREGIWTQEDLDTVGLRVVEMEPVPEGHRETDGPRPIEEVDGKLVMRRTSEPTPVPPVRSSTQNLTDLATGLGFASLTEFKAALR